MYHHLLCMMKSCDSTSFCIILISTKNRQAVLQSLLTLSREYPEKCNWEEYFKPVLLRLLDLMGDSDTTVKLYSLRVLREMLKTQHERLKDYSELTTLKVLKCFTDSDSTVRYMLLKCVTVSPFPPHTYTLILSLIHQL